VQYSTGGHDVVEQEFEQEFESWAKNHPLPIDPECDVNFTYGAANQQACADPDTERIMEDPRTCFTAAKQACPDMSCIEPHSVAPFVLVVTNDFNFAPKGCFRNPSGKWHYNPAGFFPNEHDDRFVGNPVCEIVVYRNGTDANSNDCGNDDYEPMTNEQECRSASYCLGLNHPDEFRDLNQTMQDRHPKGCHMETEGEHTGWMMYNPADNLTAGTDAPSNPRGRVLCRLKVSTQMAGLSGGR